MTYQTKKWITITFLILWRNFKQFVVILHVIDVILVHFPDSNYVFINILSRKAVHFFIYIPIDQSKIDIQVGLPIMLHKVNSQSQLKDIVFSIMNHCAITAHLIIEHLIGTLTTMEAVNQSDTASGKDVTCVSANAAARFDR